MACLITEAQHIISKIIANIVRQIIKQAKNNRPIDNGVYSQFPFESYKPSGLSL
jgi:hypothetical protein